MPIKFWDETFLTATYLIYRLPTPAIDNKCLLQRLFKTPPNYSLLWVFGCACWPHLHPYNKHKLSFLFAPRNVSFWVITPCIKDINTLTLILAEFTSLEMSFLMKVFSLAKLTYNSSNTNQSAHPSSLRIMHMDGSSTNVEGDHMSNSVPANFLNAANPASTDPAPEENTVSTDPVHADHPAQSKPSSGSLPVIAGVVSDSAGASRHAAEAIFSGTCAGLRSCII
jgi:hypothetical protein